MTDQDAAYDEDAARWTASMEKWAVAHDRNEAQMDRMDKILDRLEEFINDSEPRDPYTNELRMPG